MTDRAEQKRAFLASIVDTLRENPRWLAETFQAVAAGANAALDTVEERAHQKDRAFLAALALCDGKRMSVETKDHLNRTIVSAIDKSAACELERMALEWYLAK